MNLWKFLMILLIRMLHVAMHLQHSFNKPWLTKDILTSTAKKNALYRKQLTTNNPNIIRQYKTYRNKLTHLKEIFKQNYYKHAFSNVQSWNKKTWKLVKEIISIKNKSQQNNKLFEDPEYQKMWWIKTTSQKLGNPFLKK